MLIIYLSIQLFKKKEKTGNDRSDEESVSIFIYIWSTNTLANEEINRSGILFLFQDWIPSSTRCSCKWWRQNKRWKTNNFAMLIYRQSTTNAWIRWKCNCIFLLPRISRPIHYINMQSSLGEYITAFTLWKITGG